MKHINLFIAFIFSNMPLYILPNVKCTVPIEEMHLERFYDSQEPKTYLLSFPQSGNTWLRYCLEFLTKRPTLWKYKKGEEIKTLNCPLSYTFDLNVRMSKPCIWKVHDRQWMIDMDTFDPQEETLIFIIRNYKECFGRRFFHLPSGSSLNSSFLTIMSSYFDNLKLYDEWNPNKRLLIFYEDLMLNPHETLKTVLRFLGEETTHLDTFIDTYDFHKKQSVSTYSAQANKSITRGNDIHYFSKQLNKNILLGIDHIVQKSYPYLWNTYLKNRYAESKLDY